METCSICSQIPPSLRANTGRDEYLPNPVALLRPRDAHYSAIGTSEDLWECPECGIYYIYTTETAFTGSGNNDEDTLDRMSPADSAIVRAMYGCKGEPAELEDRVFALPPIALDKVLRGAYYQDREFVALFIPRIVFEYAKCGQSAYGSHPTRDVLHALIEKPPTFAREVLAATSSLPPELHMRLGDLEKRCKQALGEVAG